MSFIVIRQEAGHNVLCDFRPRLTTPQWWHDRRQAFKFATSREARKFLRDESKRCMLGPVKLVRVGVEKDLRAALEAILKVEHHAWKCSYCGHYADSFTKNCAGCGRVGGYCGSHDRDRHGCYRVVRELAAKALGRTVPSISTATKEGI